MGALDGVISVLNDFLAARNATAGKINSLQMDISVDKPTIVYMPFWVYGISDKQKEQITILPVSMFVRPEKSPSLQQPYVPHLSPLPGTDLRGISQMMLRESDIIAKARSSNILLESPSIIQNMDHLAKNGVLYGTNGERFIKAMAKFLLGADVRESPYVPPNWWSYDEYVEMNE